MSEGNGGNIEGEMRTPEKGSVSPTEASKRFLGKIGHRAKEAGIAIAAAITPGGGLALGFRKARLEREAQMAQAGLTANPEGRSKTEVSQQTPTEASKGFLDYWFSEELKPGLNLATKFPMAIVTETVAITLLERLGGLNIQSDIAEGRWPTLAAKGVVAGIAAVPFVRMVKDLRKKDE